MHDFMYELLMIYLTLTYKPEIDEHYSYQATGIDFSEYGKS